MEEQRIIEIRNAPDGTHIRIKNDVLLYEVITTYEKYQRGYAKLEDLELRFMEMHRVLSVEEYKANK